MYELIVILSIFLFLFSYGAIGGYLAAKQDKKFENSIIELLHVLKWSYFWPIMLINQRKNEKKIL